MLARLFALALGLLALAALCAQFAVLPPADPVGNLWSMLGYFTVLSNLLVALHMLAVALGWQISASRAAGLTVTMVTISIVYHTVLAQLWAPQGLAWWADQGLHSAVPVAMALWWLVFAPKGLVWRDLLSWLIWPVVYCVYALGRGVTSGFWAYPFLNVDVLGPGMVAVNMVVVALAFAVVGAIFLALARRMGSR